MSTEQKITNLGINFNAREVAPQQAMEAFPLGWYSAIIVGGEIKPTEGGAGRRMNLEWQITEGQYKGRKLFDGFNYIHSNQQTQQIAAGQVSAICHAVEVFDLSDITQLFNRPHQIKAGIEAAKNVDADGFECAPGTPNSKSYEARNTFKGAKSGAAPLPAAGAGGPAPAWVPNAVAPAAAAPAAPAGWPGATTPPPVAAAPVAVAPAAPAAVVPPAGKKRGPKPKAPGAAAPAASVAAAPVTAAPVEERQFYIGLPGDAYANTFPESKIVEFLRGGMPANTPLCLDGDEGWKDATAYQVGAAKPAPVAAPVAPIAQPAAAPAAAMPWNAPGGTAAPAAAAPTALPPWGN